MTSSIDLTTPIQLTAAVRARNRLYKSAMSEQMADRDREPTAELNRLYRAWAEGGVGAMSTGNVMIDRSAIGEIGNVALDESSDLQKFREWSAAGTVNDTCFFMQLNHPGKQVPSFLSKEPVAPSAIPLGAGLDKAFKPPRALENAEILEIIRRFAWCAATARDCGFTGVQIHGAHGYLVNQFLSPHHNRRTDDWGGPLENRMRFALEVYRAIRDQVGAQYPVGIKLNSADFQKGGFTEEESVAVLSALQSEGIDFVEISGGNYENPSMVGAGVKASTVAREAYFLDYAARANEVVTVPLIVTGGFRSATAINQALTEGAIDMAGMARPFAIEPNLAQKMMDDPDFRVQTPSLSTGSKFLDQMSMLDITWYEQQLSRIGDGLDPDRTLGVWKSVLKTFADVGRYAFARRRY